MKFPNLSFALPFNRLRNGNPGTPADLQAMTRKTLDAFRAAGLQTNHGAGRNAAEIIQSALTSAGLYRADGAAPQDDPSVIDVAARETYAPQRTTPSTDRTHDAANGARRDFSPALRGRTVSGTHVGRAGARSYKLYVPLRADKTPIPLLVMLHGCTQSPDDFAAGTRMNELAERHGFMVVYPEQAANANGSKCWNWYRAEDQARDRGEPSLIAGITRDIVRAHMVDEERIFVAGLSAGGAMAVILGRTYPDLYAAVGVHSGLPYGVAHDVPSAFAAMKVDPRNASFASSPPSASTRFVPTIVFHGDRDDTVDAGNGAAVIAQTLAAARTGMPPLQATEYAGSVPGGVRYTRTIHCSPQGKPLVEQWLVHGAGHAWAGGSHAGSYTDSAGPDASEAMVQFFLLQGDEASQRVMP